jgi:hypothetical protein
MALSRGSLASGVSASSIDLKYSAEEKQDLK